MRPVKKSAKLVLKGSGGSLYQLLPEVQTSSPASGSSLPVSSGSAYQAVSSRQTRAAGITVAKVTEEKPTAVNAASLPNKSVIAWLKPEEWTFSIDTEASAAGQKKSAVPFNLYGQSAEITVYWGDGTASVLSASDYAESGSTASVHEYASAGTYEIAVQCADWGSLSLLAVASNASLSAETDANSALYWWRRTLKSVQSPLPPLAGTARLANASSTSLQSGASNFTYAFCGCSKLEYVCSDLLANNAGIESASSMFEGCSSLKEIPAALFSGMEDIESFSSCFRGCSKLSAIPVGLFDSCTAAEDFSRCFQGCSRVLGIPSRLFDQNVSAEDFSFCFQGCGYIYSIPSRLFRYNEAVLTFEGCFSGCSYLGDAHLEIGSSLASSFASFFTPAADVERILCVKENTAAETAAEASASACGYTVSTDSTVCCQTFEFTVDTEAAVKGAKRTAVPFNLATVADSALEMVIDWGDDYVSTVKKANYAISDSRSSIHEYDVPGKYSIRISCSDWSAVCIHGIYSSQLTDNIVSESNINNGNSDLYYFRNTLTSVDAPLPTVKGTVAYSSPTATGTLYTYANYMVYTFALCEHLREIPEDLFWKIPAMSGLLGCFGGCISLTEIPAGLLSHSTASRFDFLFGDCRGLTSLPENLFRYNSNAANFTQCFAGCRGLTTVPENLFRYNAAATSFYALFHDCSNLQTVPAGLFSSCPNAQRFDYVFDECSSLRSVPVSIFAACPNVISFQCSFKNSGIESVPENLFLYNPNVISFSACFGGCANLRSIPEGIFSHCQSAQDFSMCFTQSGIESIPENLFRYNPNALTFSECFRVTNIETIPANLFKYNVNATIFQTTFALCPYVESVPETLFSSCVDAETFYACFSGTGLRSIPQGLFANNAEAVNFAYVFEDCANIAAVPSGLFDACVKAETFQGAFTRCTSLQTVPAGIFSRNTAATDFSYCFNHCYALQTVPTGIFASNTAAVNFEALFQMAGLTAIPSTLFVTNVLAENFNWTFYGCSAVEEIPEGLFDNCTAALSFRAAFYNTGIDEIPEGLFDSCTGATDFRYVFGMTGIEEIPADLFKYNTAAQAFTGAFCQCQSLASLPEGLFSTNTAVTALDCAFEDCSALGGFVLRIGSSSVNAVSSFVTKKTGVTRTVYVPASSTSYDTFAAAASDLGISVASL